MGVQPVYGEGPRRLLRAARGKVAIIGIPNRLNHGVTLIVYTLHKCSRGPRVGNPYFKFIYEKITLQFTHAYMHSYNDTWNNFRQPHGRMS